MTSILYDTVLIKNEVKNTLQSRHTVLMVVIGTVIAYITTTTFGIGRPTPDPEGNTSWAVLRLLDGQMTLAVLQGILDYFVFIAGFLLGYRSFDTATSEQPGSRNERPDSETISSILVGRLLAVTIITAPLVIVVLGAGTYWYGSTSLLVIIGFLFASTLYAAVCTGIGVSCRLLRAQSRSAAVFNWSFFVSGVDWNVLSAVIYMRSTGTNLGAPGALTLDFLLFERLHPTTQYRVVTNWLLDVPNSASRGALAVIDSQNDHTVIGVYRVGAAFSETPFVLDEWVSLVGMMCWGLLTIAAILLFNRDGP